MAERFFHTSSQSDCRSGALATRVSRIPASALTEFLRTTSASTQAGTVMTTVRAMTSWVPWGVSYLCVHDGKHPSLHPWVFRLRSRRHL